MKHPYDSDVKNWLCSITQNWNPAHPTQLMTASSSINTNNSMNKKKKTIKPYGLQMEPILQESIISVTNVHKSFLPQIPPWIIEKPLVILQLNKLPIQKYIQALIWKNFTLSSYTVLSINIYLWMAPRITIKQHVLLSSNHSQESPSNEKLHLHCRSMCHWPCSQHHF